MDIEKPLFTPVNGLMLLLVFVFSGTIHHFLGPQTMVGMGRGPSIDAVRLSVEELDGDQRKAHTPGCHRGVDLDRDRREAKCWRKSQKLLGELGEPQILLERNPERSSPTSLQRPREGMLGMKTVLKLR